MELTKEQWRDEALVLESCSRVVRLVGEQFAHGPPASSPATISWRVDEIVGACRMLEQWIRRHSVHLSPEPEVRARFSGACSFVEEMKLGLERPDEWFADADTPHRLASLWELLDDGAEFARVRAEG